MPPMTTVYCHAMEHLDVMERVLAERSTPDPSGCLLWTAGRTGAGYGAFYIGSKQYLAHRGAWHVAHGDIPKHLVIDHMCGVRHCVNVEHLRLLTPGDNLLASTLTPCGKNLRKTHCIRGHELAGDNLLLYTNFRRPDRAQWRGCRTCINARKREKRRDAKLAAS